MEFEQLLKLIETVSASGLNEFDYEAKDIKLHLGRKFNKNLMMPVTINSENEKINKNLMVPVTHNEISKGTDVVSPIVGVFYTASSPDAAPFVKVGDRIEKGQVIGIVEAMKLMNEIQSDVSGVVTEIYVQNGDGVEYGQPLICVQE